MTRVFDGRRLHVSISSVPFIAAAGGGGNDGQVTMTQAMQFSGFKGPFAEKIDTWNEKLYVVRPAPIRGRFLSSTILVVLFFCFALELTKSCAREAMMTQRRTPYGRKPHVICTG